MSDRNGVTILAGVLGAGWFAGAAAAQTPTPVPVSAASSAAYGVAANFTGGGMSTALGPVAPVFGTAPPAYSKSEVVPSYTGSVAIPPLVPSAVVFPMVAELTVDASLLVSHVASPGFGVDDISSTGTSTIDAVQLRIANPGPVPPPIAAAPAFLSVIATEVAASASFSKVVPIAPVVTGSAGFGSLTIAGSLLGGEAITYSGSAPANTVLYRSATITITADQQVRAVLVSCPPCVVAPAQIVVHALDIAFHDAVIDGRSFSGDIVLGDAAAGP